MGTPGPWVVRINGRTASIVTLEGRAVALLQQVHLPHVVPNAYMIAAAPAMFDYIQEKANNGDFAARQIVDLALGTSREVKLV